jgi:class 3 adenylate cyclase/tetratricopeptide (TPR) repeat protein
LNCPKCQFENPEGKKFCGRCGTKIESICPKCQSPNPPDFQFCGDCGHNISIPSEPTRRELSFDEKLEKIQKYLPKGITEKILSQRNKIEGEKRQVTVLFCDMKGFTPLADKLGPEEVYAMMDEVYEILIHRVHAYEGTVNEMTGDGVMALFGAPIALEDAPQRALRSAISIHREISRYNEKVKREKGDFPPIQMRIGIHTGPVVVGTLGNDLRVEFKAVGDTVNLAARMEQLAEPGTTYVTEDTFKLTEGYFRFEALGDKEIKGKERSLRVYRIIAASTRRTRFDVSAERGLTPFVGRHRELELLLDGYERSKEGRGQAISIISEAGIGKSRLLYEFRKAVTNEDVTFLEGRCLSYSRNIAYHPIVDVLRANFEIEDMDTDEDIRQKITRFLKALNIDKASTLPFLLELLSVKESGIDNIPMSPEARKERTLEALKRIAIKGSEGRPLIMAIEDLHWMDRSSEDALKELLESIPGARVFLIFTYRPEFVHTWGSRSYHSQVTLNRLSNRESLAMIEHVLAARDIDRNLEDLILQKAEGIPFFIEEFIKSLKDLKIIKCRNGEVTITQDIMTVSIPSTIQEVIMSRIDKLPEGAREVLRTGSVIEREFSHELIRRVTGLPEQELLSHLSTLRDSELLYERGIYPSSTYIFKHALTREVAYDSILTKKRKQIHAKIARTIEEIHGDDICDCYGVLANHCMASEDYEKSAEYSRLASRQAEKTASMNDAIAYANKRVTSLESLPRTDEVDKQIIDARTSLGIYMAQMHYFVEAKEAVDPIIDLAIRHDYKKRLCQLYTILGTYHGFAEENFPESFKTFEMALKISSEVKDVISSVLASSWFGNLLGWNCDFEKALKCYQRALDINVKANNLWGIAISKSNLAETGYYYAGKIDLAFQTTLDAVRIAEESGDIYSKPMPYTLHGLSCYGKGLLKEAEEHLLIGVKFCERINFHSYNAYAQLYLGEIYFETGDFLKSKEAYEKQIRLFENMRYLPSWTNLGKVGLARSKVMNEERDLNLESLYTYSRNNKLKVNEGWIQRYIGEILLNIDDRHISDSEHWIQKAIEADQRNRMMFHLGKDHSLYADFFKKKGDVQGAKVQLTKAIDLFKECGADGWVTRTEKTLAELS